jgi:acyl-CoA reductase-like NAD-dependent aldehyde dehydrogenase
MEKSISEMSLDEANEAIAEAQADWSRLWNKVGVRAEVLENYIKALKAHTENLQK